MFTSSAALANEVADSSKPKVMAAKTYARPIVRLQFKISLFQSSYLGAPEKPAFSVVRNKRPDAPECAWTNSLIEICSEKSGQLC